MSLPDPPASVLEQALMSQGLQDHEHFNASHSLSLSLSLFFFFFFFFFFFLRIALRRIRYALLGDLW